MKQNTTGSTNNNMPLWQFINEHYVMQLQQLQQFHQQQALANGSSSTTATTITNNNNNYNHNQNGDTPVNNIITNQLYTIGGKNDQLQLLQQQQQVSSNRSNRAGSANSRNGGMIVNTSNSVNYILSTSEVTVDPPYISVVNVCKMLVKCL